jgi:Fe-S oxidoreductase
LKTREGNELFRIIAVEIAALVKKYRGSLSGEHGDGRLRGEFIRQMIGEKNYELLRQIKKTWDPENIFNPHKIVDTPSMNSMLRYQPGQAIKKFHTHFRFYNQDILQHAEQCNGSGDCRKTELSGGTMCPSYMATRNEKDTTRARANILREMLTHTTKRNPFDHPEIYEVMDLCLSCKGCKSECPSNVDVAKLKAEFLQHYYDQHGVPFRTRLIANFSRSAKFGSILPGIYNRLMNGAISGKLIKRISGFAEKRSIPLLEKQTLKSWYKKRADNPGSSTYPNGQVYFFCDEFTNYNDVGAGVKAIRLLERLGYQVTIPDHTESGRTWLSKGLLKKAKLIINRNIDLLAELVSENRPLVGLEPSAILSFRDEYIDLATDKNFERAKEMSKHVFMLDEFLAKAIDEGRIKKDQFKKEKKEIKLHGHCQQKAISSAGHTAKILSFPENYSVQVIPSGCCGMAGSFGYEKEHYDLSMKIGGLVLFPAVSLADTGIIIAAPGTSCRHQIKDGTGKIALHPAEILHDALI